VNISCKICEKRRARRHCPGVEGEICPQCCGMERENTIDCPSSCDYLREARFHEQPPPIQDGSIPNTDIRLSEDFLREQEALIYTLTLALKRAIDAAKAVDYDAREGLAALIRNYRATESGLIYESHAPNAYAEIIQKELRAGIEELRQGMIEQAGGNALRDADVLGVLVFLQRIEIKYNNGRKRGRAFRDFLHSYVPEPPAEPATA
jgi:hypothetical protein